MPLRRTATVTICVVFSASTLSAGPPSPPADALAIVNREPITAANLDGPAKAQIRSLEEQLHTIRVRALDQRIAETLIEQEARRRGMTPERLIQQLRAEGTVSEADLDHAAREALLRSGGSPSDVREQVRQQLLAQAGNRRLDELVKHLRATGEVRVLLPELPPEQAHVSIEATDRALGPVDARVTITEFADYQCPYCAEMEPIVRDAVQQNAGKVRWVFKNYPLPSHSLALDAAEAAECAGDQGKYWEYGEKLFQTHLDAATWKTLATALNLDAGAVAACMESGRHIDVIQRQLAEGRDLGVSGTPTFVINGRVVRGAINREAFDEIVRDELATASRTGATNPLKEVK